MAKGDSEQGNPFLNAASSIGTNLGSSMDLYGGTGGVGPSQNVAQALQDVMGGTQQEQPMTPFQRMLMEYDRTRLMDMPQRNTNMDESRSYITGDE